MIRVGLDKVWSSVVLVSLASEQQYLTHTWIEHIVAKFILIYGVRYMKKIMF